MEGLLREGYYLSAVCGGRGHCGKCRVRILEGTAPVTVEDGAVFTEEELADGWRLSCRSYPSGRLKVLLKEMRKKVLIILEHIR